VIVMSTTLATGGTAIAAVDRLKEHGAQTLRFLCLLAAPEGIEKFHAYHPDVGIWTAAIDERLDEEGYILPGLGDAGDRLYGSK
jgi:uracil phosphoribosyltransferase